MRSPFTQSTEHYPIQQRNGGPPVGPIIRINYLHFFTKIIFPSYIDLVDKLI